MKREALIGKAMEAVKNAYAPYSHFNVGAALLTKNGEVYTGFNIENASYSLTNCAERTALFSAVNCGERDFAAIAIVGGKNGRVESFCPPCGACRQVLKEFCGKDFLIYLYDGSEIKTYTLDELLPMAFEV